jgi:hypothetical protein
VVKGECRVGEEMLNVRGRSGGEIVQHGDLVALAQQGVGQVGSDESGPARNENAHPRSFAESL